MKNQDAFPFEETIRYKDRQDGIVFHPGMTLRDYFAGQALLNSELAGMFGPTIGPDERKRLAEFMYELADAMLKERDK